MGTLLIVLRGLLGGLLFLCLLSYLIVDRSKKRKKNKLAAAWARKQFTAEELKADLDFFYDAYKRVHPVPFHSISDADFGKALKAISGSLRGSESRLWLYRSLAPFISTLNDEHTVIYFPEPELEELINQGVKLFPLKVQFIAGKCYVKDQNGGHPDVPAGSEIVAINQLPIEDITKKISQYFSGTRAQQRLYYAQLRFPETLYFAHGFRDAFEVVTRTPAGNESTIALQGKTYKPDIRHPYSYEIQNETILFHYHAFEDPNNNFQTFLQNMFSDALQKEINTLVIDLRDNQGGTSSLGDDLLRHLSKKPFCQFDHIELKSSAEVKAFFLSFIPAYLRWFFPLPYFHPMLRSLWKTRKGELAAIPFKPVDLGDNPLLFQGQVFLLIGPGSMSSSSLLAATVKQDRIGKLIGKPTGGFPTHYGNMLEINLPNTGITVSLPSSINYGNGEGPVMPDLLVEQTPEDLAAGKDTLIEFALTHKENP